MVLATKKNCQRVLAAGLRVVSAITGNPPLGWQNLDRTIAYTRFHRIKGGGGGGGGVLPPPPPITLIEWTRFKDFYESCSL